MARHMKSNHFVIFLLLLASAAAFVCVVLRPASPVGIRPTNSDLDLCADVMQVSFPQQTRGLMMHYETSGIDDAIYLKVEFNLSDLDEFIQGSPFAEIELSGTENVMFPDSQMPWWDTQDVTRYLSGVVRLPEGRFLRILIDLVRGDACTVYLEWFET